jgi:hypothetical protein
LSAFAIEKVTVMGRSTASKILIAITATLAGSIANADGWQSQFEPEVSGIRLQIDNDLFAGGERDRDYTGGFALSFSGADARDRYLSIDPALAAIDSLT